MKKLFLCLVSIGCFVSAHAQWTDTPTTPIIAPSEPGEPTYYNKGNVGIGTAGLPVTKLDLGNNFGEPGAFPNKISLYHQANNHYYGFGISPGSLDYFSAAYHTFHVFDAQGVRREAFKIWQNGNVAIGTPNPGTFKLAVEGQIGARGIHVKAPSVPWADYVFENTYKLRPLFEVEKYVQQYKHLPEVPSATEVEKNGINLGEMDALLLKKIEELTLYLIEQKKQLAEQNQLLSKQNELIEELKKENSKQGQQIDSLKKSVKSE